MNQEARMHPRKIEKREQRFPFDETKVPGKKTGLLPAMGWNSWNAFGSGNTEELTKQMADQMLALGLDRFGYQYIVLDDGCYKSERVNGKLSNDEVKFPSGFRALADYMHERGLKFGMYNDIGDRLCAGAWVGTCGYEAEDAASYISWDIDFIKVDNCYYLWDNATFSDGKNAKYVYAPKIRSVRVSRNGNIKEYDAVSEGRLTGEGGRTEEGYVSFLGTIDGTNIGPSPVGPRFSELEYDIFVEEDGEYDIEVCYCSGAEEGVGNWLQLAVGDFETEIRYFDDLLEKVEDFTYTKPMKVMFQKGENRLRLMNHRRQENTLLSYATLLQEMSRINPNHHILLSTCEWGKTQPQNWAYKLAVSWRILNDITWHVGSDGDWGRAFWESTNTNSITSQYNKAVVMWQYSGLDKGWNDPDMMVIGMNDLAYEMNKTHMVMWCMLNAPLMLGMDLRRVKVGDKWHQIIANEDLIALNQDPLGVQARRIFTSVTEDDVDTEYITNNHRVDLLAKPLADGSVALSFINLSGENQGVYEVDVNRIVRYIGDVMVNKDGFLEAKSYKVYNLWSKEMEQNTTKIFSVHGLAPYEAVVIRVVPESVSL